MILESTSTVPMNDGKYFGKITGSLVDARVQITDKMFFPVSFHVHGELGNNVPVVIVVKDSYASVHVED